MFTYQVHTIESAPGKSKPALEQLERVFGFVPNIAGAIANSPVLANSLLGLFQNVHGGSFTEAEIQTLLLTNAVTNSSPWAVAFSHCAGAEGRLRSCRCSSHPRAAATETSPIRCPFQIGKDVDRESRPGDRWRSNDFRRSRI